MMVWMFLLNLEMMHPMKIDLQFLVWDILDLSLQMILMLKRYLHFEKPWKAKFFGLLYLSMDFQNFVMVLMRCLAT